MFAGTGKFTHCISCGLPSNDCSCHTFVNKDVVPNNIVIKSVNNNSVDIIDILNKILNELQSINRILRVR